MSPEGPGDNGADSKRRIPELPTEKASRAQRVRRVYDRNEMETFYRNWFRTTDRKVMDNPQTVEEILAANIYQQAIDHIRRDMHERIYWGLYNDWGELLRMTEIREIERLTGQDALAFQKLYLKGLKEDPPAFGSRYEEEKKKMTPDEKELTDGGRKEICKFLEENYAVGVKYAYVTDVGEVKERIVGFAFLMQRPGTESHKGYAGRLYVHKAHQGRGIAKSILLHLFDKAESLGLKHVDAVVVASNKWLRQWYANLGFRDTRTEYDAVEIDGTSYDWVHIRLDMDTYRKNRGKL